MPVELENKSFLLEIFYNHRRSFCFRILITALLHVLNLLLDLCDLKRDRMLIVQLSLGVSPHRCLNVLQHLNTLNSFMMVRYTAVHTLY